MWKDLTESFSTTTTEQKKNLFQTNTKWKDISGISVAVLWVEKLMNVALWIEVYFEHISLIKKKDCGTRSVFIIYLFILGLKTFADKVVGRLYAFNFLECLFPKKSVTRNHKNIEEKKMFFHFIVKKNFYYTPMNVVCLAPL